MMEAEQFAMIAVRAGGIALLRGSRSESKPPCNVAMQALQRAETVERS
jgi:hypothetical protein